MARHSTMEAGTLTKGISSYGMLWWIMEGLHVQSA